MKAHEPPLEITVAQFAARLDEVRHSGGAGPASQAGGDGLLLIDCREVEEHAIAQIDGSLLIPMQEISTRLAELKPWRDRPIVVHCHHGVRSLHVVRFLRTKGFHRACSLAGGIDAWSTGVDPTVPRY